MDYELNDLIRRRECEHRLLSLFYAIIRKTTFAIFGVGAENEIETFLIDLQMTRVEMDLFGADMRHSYEFCGEGSN